MIAHTRSYAQPTQLTPTSWVRPLIATLMTAACCNAVWADEPSPWYIGGDVAATYDSNVTRTKQRISDFYYSTGLLGGFDQPISRQRLYANGNVRYNKYQRLSGQDNTSYGIAAGWDWATIEKVSGGVNFNANQSLASSSDNQTRPTSTRNVLNTDQLGANVRLGGDALLSLQGSYSHSRVRYSAPEYFASRSSTDSGSIGAFYRASADLKFGLALRLSNTTSPYAVAQATNPVGPSDYSPNTSKGNNIDLTTNWKSSAQTGLNARLSWTKQSNSSASGRDFSGLTWGLAGTYAPTAKLGLNASLNRDAGSNSSGFVVPVSDTNSTNGTSSTQAFKVVNENSRTTDSYALGANLEVTSKMSLNAGLQYNYAELVDTRSLNGNDFIITSQDTGRSASLGASYAFSRGMQLGCNFSFQSRSVSDAAGISYNAKVASCNAKLTLQ
jgi:hypothetical protein